MIRFNEYVMIKENFNQMKSLIQKNEKDVTVLLFGTQNGISPMSEIYQVMRVLIGPDINHKTVSTNTKFKELYGDIEVNEDKERTMRPYLGMFAKMFYEEKCPVEIISDISQYILHNKATLNQLKVKNNHTGELTPLSNILDIFKFKDSIKANDTRPAYEILTDAIRDKDKNTNITRFINQMPSILKSEFKEDTEEHGILANLISLYEKLDREVKDSIYSTFFGNGSTKKGKISKYKNVYDFLTDFEMMVKNPDDFNTDIIKTRDKILETKGAKLVLCDLRNNIVIADIWNYTASNILGEPASWCISYKDNSGYWYNTYMSLSLRRKMYFIWNFNLPFNDTNSKIGANINSDGSYYLICDKNDTAIKSDIFKEYLKTYNIDSKLLSSDISPEEQKFKENDYNKKDVLSGKLFNRVTDENFKTMIPSVIDICKQENVDITQNLLLDNLARHIYSLDNNFEAIKLILNILGTEKYQTIFTSILNTIQPRYISYYDDLIDLYEMLGSKIDFNIFSLERCEIDLSNIQVIEKLILDNYEYQYYNGKNDDTSSLEQIIEFLVSEKLNNIEYIDNNFEKFWNRFWVIFDDLNKHNSSFSIAFIIRIISDLTSTQNNFLTELNKIYLKDRDANADISNINVSISDITGLQNTELCYTFFENIISYYIKYHNFDTESTKNIEIIKIFVSNHSKYLQTIFEENLYYKRAFVKFIQIIDFDVRQYKIGNIQYYEAKKLYNMSDILYLISIDYMDIVDYKAFNRCIEDVYKLSLYSGENIAYIQKIVKLIEKSDFDISLDTPENIALTEYILDHNKQNVYVISKCLIQNILVEKCLPYLKDIPEDEILTYVGFNEIADNYIIQNYDLTDVDITAYNVNNLTPILLNKLLDAKCTVHKYEYIRILENGIFEDDNMYDISIECIKKIGIDNIKVKKEVASNSLRVIKYLFENKIIVDISYGANGNGDEHILNTNDLDKIKYFANIIKYDSERFYYGKYKLNFDVLEYLLNSGVCNIPQLFNNVVDTNTFIELYNKYWKDFTYQECNYIVSEYLEKLEKQKYTYYINILDFLYDNEYGTLSEIVNDNYEEKKKRIYSEEIREWIKNKFFTKQSSTKVKKIREMFEYVFKNL